MTSGALALLTAGYGVSAIGCCQLWGVQKMLPESGMQVWVGGKRARLVLLILIPIIAVALIAITQFQWFDQDQPFTCHYAPTSDKLAAEHPGQIQLVGFARFRRTHGVLSRKQISATEMTWTVLRKDNKYYAVWGEPIDFLRGLLDSEKHPLLTQPPQKMEPLDGSTDDEALGDALQHLREQFERS